MRDKTKGFPACRRRVMRKRMTIATMALILAAGAAGFGLTDEKPRKAQMISNRNTTVKNALLSQEQLNPLRDDPDEELRKAVGKHYRKLAQKADFVEEYRDIKVYTKKGQNAREFVAFVTYGMKIRDIYTAVPGLGTLYIRQDQNNGEYKVQSGNVDAETEAYIKRMAGQQDVQALLADTEAEYKKAVQADALLQEALEDLKNAYEDSTGR